MKKYLLSFLFLASCLFLYAGEVNVRTAQSAGAAFLSKASKNAETTAANLQLAYTAESETIPGFQLEQSNAYFYVFNAVADTGFVIVAADDRSFPILGYSTESYFDPENMSQNFVKCLENYREQLRHIIVHDLAATEAIASEWKSLKNAQYAPKSVSAVTPLLATKWDQLPYYNALCPGGSVTGCVATALAMVMKYWNYPEQGTGFHSYNHPNYGTLSANFGSTTYEWSSMPNSVNSPNNAVATLMYHCGVAVEMNYSPEVSGAYVISAYSEGEHCTEYALKTYFKYKSSLQGILRDNYNESTWIGMMKTELDAKRPILYAGFGSGGGHAFVCDGYDNSNYFHFNWGWSGQHDGYFQVGALNPGGTGTGGGTGDYNSIQQMIIGVEPPDGGGGGGGGGSTHNLQLYTYLTPSSGQIYYGQQFSVATNIVNMGSTTFSGDYGAAVFDESLTFIDFVDILYDYSLQPGYVYNNNLVFSSTGLLSMLPGRYYVAVFYRPTGGDWEIVGNGEYYNITQIDVINPSDIEVYSDMLLSPAVLVQGKPFSVVINVANAGYNTFVGSYGVGLFDMFDGSLKQEIQILNETQGLPPGYCYAEPGITFTTSSITVPPGTYLLAIQHKPNSGYWTLSGSSYFQNPIKVIVQAPGLQADKYEPNDDVPYSYTLPVSFSGNKAVVKTDGANLHHGQDYDYYKIELPAGEAYSFLARVHDKGSAGHTADVVFCYSLDGVNASDIFDTAMPKKVIMNNGGTVYLAVAPCFAGETGSYLLEIELERGTIGIDEVANENEPLKVYPNPTSGELKIENEELKMENMELFDIFGKKVFETKERAFDISHLPAGVYLLKVGGKTAKVVKY